MKMKKPTVFIIKSSPWETAYQSKNHPEYSAIFDLLHLYESKIRFILVGTSTTRTYMFLLKNKTIAWDIKAKDWFSNLKYQLNLIMLLLKYRPNLIIILGLLNVLPIAFYSFLSWKSKYVPVFIGEFGYHGTNKINQLLMILELKCLGICLQLSYKKIVGAFTLSRHTLKNIEKLAPNMTGKIKLISYPISPKFRTAQQKFVQKSSEEPIILTVAGIEPRKGIDTLIKAISLIQRKVKLIVKGSIRDDDYFDKLMTMVKKIDIQDRVTFVTENIDYDALISYYKSATLFVFPTRDDCLGMVILEALHSGLPVIATSVGGVPDMIENGVNGILVEPNNPYELANAILLLLADTALRRKLATNAIPILISRYYKGRVTLKEALIQSINSLDL